MSTAHGEGETWETHGQHWEREGGKSFRYSSEGEPTGASPGPPAAPPVSAGPAQPVPPPAGPAQAPGPPGTPPADLDGASLDLILDILSRSPPGPDGKPTDDAWAEAQEVLDHLQGSPLPEPGLTPEKMVALPQLLAAKQAGAGDATPATGSHFSMAQPRLPGPNGD